jgi:sec-independent protein translocase protein TatC
MSEAEPLDEVEEHRMPLIEHLRELRKRVIISAVTLAICAGFCLIFSNELIDLLAAPIRQVLEGEEPTSQADKFYAWLTSPMHRLPGWEYFTSGQAKGQLSLRGSLEGFYTYIRVGLMGGAMIASPILAYQGWQFVAPGLYKTERKYVLPLTVASTSLFLFGASFAYIVILPLAFRFFTTVVEVEAILSIDDALKTVIRIMVAFGLAYQLPVATWFLAKLGLIDHRDMIKGFRYAIVAIFAVYPGSWIDALIVALRHPQSDDELHVWEVDATVLLDESLGRIRKRAGDAKGANDGVIELGASRWPADGDLLHLAVGGEHDLHLGGVLRLGVSHRAREVVEVLLPVEVHQPADAIEVARVEELLGVQVHLVAPLLLEEVVVRGAGEDRLGVRSRHGCL